MAACGQLKVELGRVAAIVIDRRRRCECGGSQSGRCCFDLLLSGVIEWQQIRDVGVGRALRQLGEHMQEIVIRLDVAGTARQHKTTDRGAGQPPTSLPELLRDTNFLYPIAAYSFSAVGFSWLVLTLLRFLYANVAARGVNGALRFLLQGVAMTAPSRIFWLATHWRRLWLSIISRTSKPY